MKAGELTGYTMIICRPPVKPTSMKIGDLEIGDVDDFDDELNDVQLQPSSKASQRKQVKLDSKPIDTHTAIVSLHGVGVCMCACECVCACSCVCVVCVLIKSLKLTLCVSKKQISVYDFSIHGQ